MNKSVWQKAFGDIPEDYTRRLNATLNALTETPERRVVRRPALVLAAVLLLILGVAAAAGTAQLFNIFGKSPLDGAEDGIVGIAAAPVRVNDDITAKVDYAYYDGVDIYYEMTLALADPDKYRIFCDDQGLYLNSYTPSGEFVALDVLPVLFDFFELADELGEEYEPANPDMNHHIEHIDGGEYRLYGNYHYDSPNGMALPDEMDLDVTLQIRYDPTVESFHLLEPVEAEIPFHVTRTAPSGSYALTPIEPPADWTLTSAEYTQSKISGHISLAYNFGGPVIEAPLHHSGTDTEQLIETLTMDSYSYIFRLIDPETGSVIAQGKSSWSNYELFFCGFDTPPMEQIPETFTIEVIQENNTIVDSFIDEYGDEVVEFETDEVSLGFIEFKVTRK